MKDLSFIKTLLKKNINFVNGFDMGIPLNIIQSTFTTLHYGDNIITSKLFALQFLIGFYTYSQDRYRDAIEWDRNKFDTNKKDLFEHLLKFKIEYRAAYDISLLIIIALISSETTDLTVTISSTMLLLLTQFYSDIKRINPFVKPSFIAIMWTLCCSILPSVLHDHNYSILQFPMDYLPILFTMFACSNNLDIRDIDEDQLTGVKTIPVEYGKFNSQQLSLIMLIASSLILGLNDHYLDSPILNSLWELQNVGLAYYTFSKTSVDSK